MVKIEYNYTNVNEKGIDAVEFEIDYSDGVLLGNDDQYYYQVLSYEEVFKTNNTDKLVITQSYLFLEPELDK